MSFSNQTVARVEWDVPERPYGRSLPMLLMRCRETVMRRIRPHLRSRGLTDQQWRILRALAMDDRLELLDLSQRCLIQPPSLSRTVPALAERGLVRREDHPTDRRRAVISLTVEGRELFEEVSLGSARIYQQIRKDIGENTVDELYRILINLIDILEATAEDDEEPRVEWDVPERPYGRSLPMLLMRCRETVMRRIRPHLRSRGLTDQQWRILRALAMDDRLELLDLSQRCLIQPPSLSRTVPALAERGLVRREDHPTDRRRAVISLTVEGRELFEEVSLGSARIYEQIRKDIGENEIEDLYRRLVNLINVLEATDRRPTETSASAVRRQGTHAAARPSRSRSDRQS